MLEDTEVVKIRHSRRFRYRDDDSCLDAGGNGSCESEVLKMSEITSTGGSTVFCTQPVIFSGTLLVHTGF